MTMMVKYIIPQLMRKAGITFILEYERMQQMDQRNPSIVLLNYLSMVTMRVGNKSEKTTITIPLYHYSGIFIVSQYAAKSKPSGRYLKHRNHRLQSPKQKTAVQTQYSLQTVNRRCNEEIPFGTAKNTYNWLILMQVCAQWGEEMHKDLYVVKNAFKKQKVLPPHSARLKHLVSTTALPLIAEGALKRAVGSAARSAAPSASLGAGVLGDGPGALRHGVLGQLAVQQQAHAISASRDVMVDPLLQLMHQVGGRLRGDALHKRIHPS
ncbi:hypothetical protein HPG69_008134 [Diceros bicornis minor]|uniref:Uncharacterized protein n=1 Tax=Diceros bicornis minor TaxID=77932 RepID=A0A7J7F6Y0_DICBM|nr:hypothetical protein HPG69_008134 [Diceros bicornis minor]